MPIDKRVRLTGIFMWYFLEHSHYFVENVEKNSIMYKKSWLLKWRCLQLTSLLIAYMQLVYLSNVDSLVVKGSMGSGWQQVHSVSVKGYFKVKQFSILSCKFCQTPVLSMCLTE